MPRKKTTKKKTLTLKERIDRLAREREENDDKLRELYVENAKLEAEEKALRDFKAGNIIIVVDDDDDSDDEVSQVSSSKSKKRRNKQRKAKTKTEKAPKKKSKKSKKKKVTSKKVKEPPVEKKSRKKKKLEPPPRRKRVAKRKRSKTPITIEELHKRILRWYKRKGEQSFDAIEAAKALSRTTKKSEEMIMDEIYWLGDHDQGLVEVGRRKKGRRFRIAKIPVTRHGDRPRGMPTKHTLKPGTEGNREKLNRNAAISQAVYDLAYDYVWNSGDKNTSFRARELHKEALKTKGYEKGDYSRYSSRQLADALRKVRDRYCVIRNVYKDGKQTRFYVLQLGTLPPPKKRPS